jgi:hypothetical protein
LLNSYRGKDKSSTAFSEKLPSNDNYNDAFLGFWYEKQ